MDTAGNVWEGCEDAYDRHYYANSPFENPSNLKNGGFRVVRGGSWCYLNPYFFCATFRLDYGPANSSFDVGFRVSAGP